MGSTRRSFDPKIVRPPRRLSSWKEIANHLGTSVRTVQRWEQAEQLPVHRHEHAGGGTVYAESVEIDAWLANRSRRPLSRKWRWIGLGLLALTLMLAIALLTRNRLVIGVGAIRSIGVLPLKDLSGDAEREYFAAGMTEELIDKLAQVHSLRVISRTSMMRYKQTRKSVPEIARELGGVDGLVEGTVARSGQTVRISVSLVHVATDRRLWTRSYERQLQDILWLQEDVARDVAAHVRAELGPSGADPDRNRKVDPEAYEALLRGRFHASRWDHKGLVKSIEFFDAATRRDPNYALAWALLAHAVGMVEYQEDLPASNRWVTAARRAVELDPSLPEARINIADQTLFDEWDWTRAETEFRWIVDMQPNSADAREHYAICLWTLGRKPEALRQMEQARVLDPLSPRLNQQTGALLRDTGQSERAISQFEKTIEIDPANVASYNALADLYEQAGRSDKAKTALLKAEALNGLPDAALRPLEISLAREGLPAARRKIAEQRLARLLNRERDARVSPRILAATWLAAGDADKAMDLLELAYRQKCPSIVWINVGHAWDGLRADRRFQDLLRRMKFPD